LRFIFITIFLSIFVLNLSAEDAYKRIIITKTLKESSLKEIKMKLDAIGIAMYVKKSWHNNNYNYYVYSKKYDSDYMIKKDLKNIRTMFKSAYIIEKKKEVVHKKEKKATKISSHTPLSPYFIGVNLGFDNISGTSSSSSSTETSSSGVSFGIEGGYVVDDDISISLGYLNTSSSDISINNLYISGLYKITNYDEIDIYGGLLLGYSILELTNFKYTKPSSSSLAGLQFGAKYNFDKNIAFFTNYQGMMMDHIVKITDDNSEIKFSFIHNLQLGLLYRF